MNTQQKLADILMLVTYIKEHVDSKPSSTESSRLDEIGKTTLEIAEMLHSVEEQTGTGSKTLFDGYKSSVDKIAEMVLNRLNEIKKELDSNTSLTKDLYSKVEDIYTKYTGILEESTRKLELQRETYVAEIQALGEKVQTLGEKTKGLTEKVMTEGQMKELTANLETKVSEIVERDTALNKTYLEHEQHLEEMIKDIQKSYHSLNETLLSVDGSFKTAVSRLDVLLVQAKLLTGERGN